MAKAGQAKAPKTALDAARAASGQFAAQTAERTGLTGMQVLVLKALVKLGGSGTRKELANKGCPRKGYARHVGAATKGGLTCGKGTLVGQGMVTCNNGIPVVTTITAKGRKAIAS